MNDEEKKFKDDEGYEIGAGRPLTIKALLPIVSDLKEKLNETENEIKKYKAVLIFIGDICVGYDGAGENIKALQELIDEVKRYAYNPEQAYELLKEENKKRGS